MLIIDVCSFKMICKSHRLWLGMFLYTWVTPLLVCNNKIMHLKDLKIMWALLCSLMSVHPLIWQNVHKIDRQIELDPPIRTAGGSRFGVPLFPHVCQILFVNDHVLVEPVERFRRTRPQSSTGVRPVQWRIMVGCRVASDRGLSGNLRRNVDKAILN